MFIVAIIKGRIVGKKHNFFDYKILFLIIAIFFASLTTRIELAISRAIAS